MFISSSLQSSSFTSVWSRSFITIPTHISRWCQTVYFSTYTLFRTRTDYFGYKTFCWILHAYVATHPSKKLLESCLLVFVENTYNCTRPPSQELCTPRCYLQSPYYYHCHSMHTCSKKDLSAQISQIFCTYIIVPHWSTRRHCPLTATFYISIPLSYTEHTRPYSTSSPLHQPITLTITSSFKKSKWTVHLSLSHVSQTTNTGHPCCKPNC